MHSVDNDYFTDCTKELQYITQFLHSENHLILINPRRYGKSCPVRKAIRQTERPCVYINLWQATSAKNDEFYTQLADINKEMQAHLDYYPDKMDADVARLECVCEAFELVPESAGGSCHNGPVVS